MSTIANAYSKLSVNHLGVIKNNSARAPVSTAPICVHHQRHMNGWPPCGVVLLASFSAVNEVKRKTPFLCVRVAYGFDATWTVSNCEAIRTRHATTGASLGARVYHKNVFNQVYRFDCNWNGGREERERGAERGREITLPKTGREDTRDREVEVGKGSSGLVA